MSIEELLRKCEDSEKRAVEFGREAFMILVLPRVCKGETARVFPGVMGKVLDTATHEGKTVVRVKTADVRRYLARNGVAA